MFIKPRSRSTRGYTIYAITGTTLELILFFLIFFIILPAFKINLDWWIIAAVIAVELAISAFTYIMGRRALSKSLIYGADSMVGCTGIVAGTLNPTGYVKIRGELWKAVCKDKVEAGTEVIVTDMTGMKLTVVPSHDSDSLRKVKHEHAGSV